jgi:hypothetical protein
MLMIFSEQGFSLVVKGVFPCSLLGFSISNRISWICIFTLVLKIKIKQIERVGEKDFSWFG